MTFENWTIDELFERCIDIEDGSVFMNSDEVAALRRKITEIRSSQPVSQGYKLVPSEPTPKQWAAGLMAIGAGMDKVTLIYKAMLAAAPEGGNG
jgi:hypothetical protein